MPVSRAVSMRAGWFARAVLGCTAKTTTPWSATPTLVSAGAALTRWALPPLVGAHHKRQPSVPALPTIAFANGECGQREYTTIERPSASVPNLTPSIQPTAEVAVSALLCLPRRTTISNRWPGPASAAQATTPPTAETELGNAGVARSAATPNAPASATAAGTVTPTASRTPTAATRLNPIARPPGSTPANNVDTSAHIRPNTPHQ